MTRVLLVVTETDDFVNAHLFRRSTAAWCRARGWALDTIAVEASERLERELGPVEMPETGGQTRSLSRADGRRITELIDAAADRGGEYTAALFFGFSGYLLRFLGRGGARRVLVYDAHVLRGIEELARQGGAGAMARLLGGVEVVCPYHEEFGEGYEAIGIGKAQVRFCLQPVDEGYLGGCSGYGDGDGYEGCIAVPGENFRDLEMLAEAVDGLRADVVVAAGGRELPELRGTGLRELPRLTYREYCGLIARAGVVALPVQGENAGLLSLSMAMTMGRAVVITRTRFSEPYVEHKVSGLLVPPRDARALRKALKRLVADAEQRARLGAAARERALPRQSFGALLESLLG